ncbi:MAG: hypothetical protein ACJ74Q_04515 [Pyrinomonadaceae bacterium]
MIFLIQYDRSLGQVMALKAFSESDRPAAEEARLEVEIRLNHDGIDREVVILEAESEEALRRTHRRYFENLSELASPSPR